MKQMYRGERAYIEAVFIQGNRPLSETQSIIGQNFCNLHTKQGSCWCWLISHIATTSGLVGLCLSAHYLADSS